ncbi:MAG TPA: class F sortase, partial [Ktedonobacteraceae bacterium]|nr:class F sortase [Ktedonobacteraceae bacterium]
MSQARRLLLARLLVCLSASLCGLAAVLLLSACLSNSTTASATGQSVVRASSGGPAPKASATPHPTPPTRPTVSPDTPLRLLIPAIGVNAPVEMLSFGANGDLATPTQHPWDDVGWYDQGPHPGERGSAVIDGHLDRPGGFPAVFWNLGHVQVGADVQVTNSTGKTLHFRVTGVMYYTPDQAPLQEIFGNQSGTYLNLITCAGDWIPSQHQTTL